MIGDNAPSFHLIASEGKVHKEYLTNRFFGYKYT